MTSLISWNKKYNGPSSFRNDLLVTWITNHDSYYQDYNILSEGFITNENILSNIATVAAFRWNMKSTLIVKH